MVKKLSLLLCAISFLALTGCNKLTQDNYSKLEMGMTFKQVEGLFGKPQKCQNVMMAMNCEWSENESAVYVQFVDNKVATYFGTKLQ